MNNDSYNPNESNMQTDILNSLNSQKNTTNVATNMVDISNNNVSESDVTKEISKQEDITELITPNVSENIKFGHKKVDNNKASIVMVIIIAILIVGFIIALPYIPRLF